MQMNVWKQAPRAESADGLVSLMRSLNFLIACRTLVLAHTLGLLFHAQPSQRRKARRQTGVNHARAEFLWKEGFVHQRGYKTLHPDDFLGAYCFSFPPSSQGHRISTHLCVQGSSVDREGGHWTHSCESKVFFSFFFN